jgi:hypothetical protein
VSVSVQCEKPATLHTHTSHLPLLRFPVRLVATATLAELGKLQTASGRLLVLGRCVVALFALGALQCHDFPHFLILSDSGWCRFLSETPDLPDLFSVSVKWGV